MKNIAVITAGLDVNHAHRIICGVTECVEENNANAFIFTCRRRFRKNEAYDEGEYNIYNLPDFHLLDGAILVNSTVGCEEVLEAMTHRIEDAKIPAVGIERDDANMFNICIDNRAAMREMVEHFVKVHGYTKINFVTGPMTNQEAWERLEAYKEVLRENGIPIEEERIYYGDFLKVTGMAAMEYFLETQKELPQAVIAENDVMAMGIYDILEKHNIKVPQDITLAGFDDDYDAKFHVPSLSSVSRRQEDVGYTACEKVLFNSKNLVGRLFIPTESHFRESCGCKEEHSEDYLTFRKNYYDRKRTSELYMEITQSMSADLVGVESFEQLRDYLRRYFLQIECEESYLFICDDFSDIDRNTDIYREDAIVSAYINKGYGENDQLLLGYDHQHFMDNSHFGFNDLLQMVKESGKTGKVYAISPVHYGNQCFGYFVICNSEFPYDNQLYYSWLTNIGNAIETIRKQKLLQSMIEKLDSVWSFDTLTKLYNRSGFRKYGLRVWKEGMSKQGILILFMDLDALKKVNDTYGHEEGDNYIRLFAGILKEIKCHGDIIMRYGGDEFVYMAPVSEKRTGEFFKKQIHDAMDKHNKESGLRYKLDASIGCYVVAKESGMNLEQAIEEADLKMYEIKRKKKRI